MQIPQNILLSIKNQILNHEKLHNALWRTITLNIPHSSLIPVLNKLIEWKFEIKQVSCNSIKVLFTERTSSEIFKINDEIKLEDLNVCWNITRKYSIYKDFLIDFEKSNSFVSNKINIKNDLKFEISLPYEQFMGREGTTSYKYTIDTFNLLQERNIYVVFYHLNNMIFEKIRYFKNNDFAIGKFIKIPTGYKITESTEIPF